MPENSTPRPQKLRELVLLIREESRANPTDSKGRFVLAFFRLAQFAHQQGAGRLLPKITIVLYRFVVCWIMGIELPERTQVGRRLVLHHGVGLVINDGAVLGNDVILRHGVTIGNNGKTTASPRVEDGVDIGAGAALIGGIVVGHGARIGANAVVLEDVPALATVAGIPARVVSRRVAEDSS